MKKLSEYSENDLMKIIAECDYDCTTMGNVVYEDVAMYDKVFETPYERSIEWVWDKEKENFILIDENEFDSGKMKKKERYFAKETILSTVKKEINAYYACICYSHLYVFFCSTIVDFVRSYDEPGYRISSILTSDTDCTIEEFFGKLEPITVESGKKYNLAILEGKSMYTREYDAPDFNIDIKKNYNDDVPIERLKEILRRKKSDLILFYGVPGGGKTSLIKWIMNNIDNEYIFIDPSLISSCSDSTLFTFMSDHKDSVFILEDCEKQLKSRENGENNTIGTLLNLTDGIIGEVLNIKFICTFNCETNEIDPALLRKGRLSLKYEFKELELDKVKAIYPAATKPMTLADAYNAEEENDFSKKEKGYIGF